MDSSNIHVTHPTRIICHDFDRYKEIPKWVMLLYRSYASEFGYEKQK